MLRSLFKSDPRLDQITAEVSRQLCEGDIVFTAIDAFLFHQVARGTGSWCSHVGIAVQEKGEWFVLESAVPVVKKCSLRRFIARSKNYQVEVRRLPQVLNPDQVAQVKLAAAKRMGTFYHLGFDYDSGRQYCSKFVYQVLEEAVGFAPGKIQTLQQLIEENPQANLNFWRVWYLGFIPWQRRAVTPASQLDDPRLITVIRLSA
ncbi:YiiX/YebB-like N1pC/P60 family cysteine hydrolase [Marinobacterium jannaschii]|uniref:YiiX/YebB-like N1pC/P60 family cysteine hydrolase n=1 Tax=Marinobacterium jannaschii TaxID=64970 RepID=UPI0006882CB3|nr:YiiX/YebB-like N1pC/P60 family cysteine hydrolase [Marinobacterium jannaschii]